MKFVVERLYILLPVMAVSIGLDRWTKFWAREELYGKFPKSYLGDTIRILYAENTGAFLSLGSELEGGLRHWLLTLLPAVLLLVLLAYILLNRSMNRPQVLAFSFILAGGLSNVYDRILDGKVVDFLNMGIGSLRTGIFNVADMSIMLGLFIMIPFLFSKPNKQEPEPVANAEEA